MLMRTILGKTATTAVLAATFLMISGAAAHATSPVEAVYPDNVAYMQGSPTTEWHVVGPHRKAYNLHVTSSARNGEFTIDDFLLIRDRKGKVFLRVQNVDPIFFAQLPAGHYVIIASSGTAQEVRRIHLTGHHTAEVNFVW